MLSLMKVKTEILKKPNFNSCVQAELPFASSGNAKGLEHKAGDQDLGQRNAFHHFAWHMADHCLSFPDFIVLLSFPKRSCLTEFRSMRFSYATVLKARAMPINM